MINNGAFYIKKNGEIGSRCLCRHPELVENYDKAIADNTQTWYCHHRLEIMPFSGKTISYIKLIKLGMYYNVQPEALIFLTEKEHKSLHLQGKQLYKGKHHSEEWKRKASETRKGKTPWNKGKYWSNHKDRGKHWYTNGVDNIRCFECPVGYHKGRTIPQIYD